MIVKIWFRSVEYNGGTGGRWPAGGRGINFARKYLALLLISLNERDVNIIITLSNFKKYQKLVVTYTVDNSKAQLFSNPLRNKYQSDNNTVKKIES